MGILDILICIALGIALVTGLVKGLISQLTSFVAVIAAGWTAVRLGISLESVMQGALPGVSPVILKIICFILIFIVVTLAVKLLGRLLEKCVKLVLLGWVNRLLGAIFAALACLLILSIAASLFDTVYGHIATLRGTTSLPPAVQASVFYKPLLNIAGCIFPYFSKLAL